ncbi:MAG: hypothetical protein U0840_12375 [Gemmataceae bacterium]
MTTASTPELHRGHIPHPQPGREPVPFFASWRSAVEHLIHHLLTAPECLAWLLVVPDLAHHIDPHDGLQRSHLAETARDSQGASAQALFDHYRAAAAAATQQAGVLCWYAEGGGCAVALGVTGVLVLIERGAVATVYIPGQGSAEAVSLAKAEDRPALSRERRLMRRGLPPREQRDRERREANWSAEEHLFYRVVRPAVQFIRGRHHSRDLDGRVRHADALLKDTLPPMSQLDLEHWRGHLQRCGAGGQP